MPPLRRAAMLCVRLRSVAVTAVDVKAAVFGSHVLDGCGLDQWAIAPRSVILTMINQRRVDRIPEHGEPTGPPARLAGRRRV